MGNIYDNDLISRQAVMDALCDGCELFHRNGEQVCLSKCEEYHFLVTLQSVTPKQKMGRWIEGRKEVYKCSACGNYALEWGGKSLESSYCPWCGAKMVEPRESEE